MIKRVVFALALILGIFTFIIKEEQIRDNYINRAQSYVVELTNADGTHGGTGSYVQAPSGNVYILTNGHVCGLADNGSIMVDGHFSAPVVAVYPNHDLCLVYNPTNHAGLKVARTARSGENVYVVGHPLLEPTSMAKGQLTDRMSIEVAMGMNIPCEGPDRRELDFLGIAKLCLRRFDAGPTTANILPGNSGSPVLDVWGHVVGVAFAGAQGTARGFIVPLEYVRNFLSRF